MSKRKRFITVLAAAVMVTALLLAVSASALAVTVSSVTVGAGETWNITQSTSTSKLVVGAGATIVAPEGKSVTLTVNGVETAIAAGTYQGLVVLTLTDALQMSQVGGPPGPPALFRAAVYVDNGALVPAKSVVAAVDGDVLTDTTATDIRLTSVGPLFNGFMIRGTSTYTINNPVIDFSGPGGNDFLGSGAGIRVDGSAKVTVNNASIVTNGVIRTAIFAGENATLTVNNSYIKTASPPLSEAGNFGAFMTSVPWPLGLAGTCRATLAIGAANVTYNNSYIGADGWGALSTDAANPGPVYLTANHCTIETLESGYGAYSDGNSLDTFNDCTFNVADMACIFTQGDVIFKQCVVNSGRFGVMQHSGLGVGNEVCDILDGTVFNTDEACIMIKSSAPIINVDHSQLNSKNGVLLHVMLSDDSGAGTNGGTTVANFSNVDLSGDVINSMTGVNVTFTPMGATEPQSKMVGGDLLVNLKSATIDGAITTATHKNYWQLNNIDNSHMSPFDPANMGYYPYIGTGTTVYGLPDNDGNGVTDPYGVKATLDANSTWVVAETSYLTGLTIEKGASVLAPAGYKLRLTVNGEWQPIKAGTYSGSIVISVSPLKVFGGTALGVRTLPATD